MENLQQILDSVVDPEIKEKIRRAYILGKIDGINGAIEAIERLIKTVIEPYDYEQIK